MTQGLWPAVQKGEPRAVAATVRVCERRARLLGLDAPTQTKTEFAGKLAIDKQPDVPFGRFSDADLAEWRDRELVIYEHQCVIHEQEQALEAIRLRYLASAK
jgi:hypothetical protein